jgi:hypothetical protein
MGVLIMYLFTGNNYYPYGGFQDYRGMFPTKEAAVTEGKRFDWYHVVVGVEIVAQS